MYMKNCQSCTNKVRNSYTYCYDCNSKRNDNLSSSFTSNTIYKKTPIPKTVRNCLWINYFKNKREDKCQCCLREIISISNFHAGHIVSEFKGGTTTLDNLRPICQLCNLSMGTQNMDDFIKKFNLHYFI